MHKHSYYPGGRALGIHMHRKKNAQPPVGSLHGGNSLALHKKVRRHRVVHLRTQLNASDLASILLEPQTIPHFHFTMSFIIQDSVLTVTCANHRTPLSTRQQPAQTQAGSDGRWATSGSAPDLWKKIHTYAAQYPEKPTRKQCKRAYKFYTKWVLSQLECQQCRTHYIQQLRSLCLMSRQHLFPWTVETHNEVNKVLGKPVVSLRDAQRAYGL